MYLSSLRIIKGIGDEEVIRDVHFKKGLNIIVDDSEEDENNGNNVGKTTFLKIIDICLGAKDKKYIWTDYDTRSETGAVKDFIAHNKVFAELKFEKQGLCYVLKVELYNNGKRYINGERLSLTEYQEKLNSIIFGIEKPPTFRQLIPKFVRIKQTQDANVILKNLHPTTSNAEYKNIYDFLFRLSSQEESNRKLTLSKEINEINNEISQLIKIHKFSNIDDLKERIKIISKTFDELKANIDEMVNVKEFAKNLHSIDDINGQIKRHNDMIDKAIFKKSKIEEILSKEETGQENIDKGLLFEFYNDVKQSLGNIAKNFDELVLFNNQIKQNKLSYYRSRLESIQSEIADLTGKREKIILENKNIISLVNLENFDTFQKMHSDLIQQSKQLGLLNEVKDLYDELHSGIKEKEAENELIVTDDSIDNLSTFNEFFTKISNEVFRQRLYLSPFNPFPLKLSNVDDGIGTGHRKTITLLLDIAYVSFINRLGLDFPRFFIHDVLETVDQECHRKIVEHINQNDSQFIFAVLNEKIKDYPFISEEDKCLRLTKEKKLFKV